MPQDFPSGNAHPAPAGTTESLRRSFIAAFAGHREGVDALRVAACEYVRDLKGRGATPEGVVIAVKDVLRRAIAGQTPTHDNRREAEALVERAVTWCIEEYYRSDGSQAVS